MIFITQYQHEKTANVEKSHEGKRLVEDAGYITIKKQIELLVQSGERLAQARLENYDYRDDVDIDEVVLPLSRSPNFDLVDAKHEYDSAIQRIKAAQENASQTSKEAPPTDEATQLGQKDDDMEPGKKQSIPGNETSN